MLSSVACPNLQRFLPHYHMNVVIFEGKIIEHRKCVVICLEISSDIFIIPRKIQCDIITNVRG